VARLHALVVALGIGAAVPAAAEVIALPHTKATVTLAAEWKPILAPALVAAYRTDGGLVLAITRAQVPNPDAWRAKTRVAYADEIERGVTSRIRGYKRLVRELGEVQGIPALDLEARRADGVTIVLRVLLFRTYALTVAIECPRTADVAAARVITRSFALTAPAP
jgi:hypothetical protein